MSRRKQAKKGVNPLVAVVMLVASMGVVGKSLLGGGATPIVPAIGGGTEANVAVEPDAGESSTATPTEAAPAWQDLLAIHGSYRKGEEVRQAFVAFEYPSSWTGPQTTGDAPVGRWEGEDPPLLRLGVVMVSATARRAVLGGKVLGVGDPFDDGKVTSIEPGVVTVSWRGRRLTYDLDQFVPREFRAEYELRKSEQRESDTNHAPSSQPASSTAGPELPAGERKEGDK